MGYAAIRLSQKVNGVLLLPMYKILVAAWSLKHPNYFALKKAAG